MRFASTLLATCLTTSSWSVAANGQADSVEVATSKEECLASNAACNADSSSAKTSSKSDSASRGQSNSNNSDNIKGGAPSKQTVHSKSRDTNGYSTRKERVAKPKNPPASNADENDLPAPDQCALYLAPSTLPRGLLGLFSGHAIPKSENANVYLGGTYPGFQYDDDDDPLWSDLYIPVADVYKTLPYRGQQRFPSWLSYVWPSEPGAFHHEGEMNPFPTFPDELKDYDDGLNHADGLEFYMDDYADDREAEEGRLHRDKRPRRRISALAPGLASLANSHPRMYNLDRQYLASRADYAGQVAPWQPGAGAFTPHHGVEFVATKGIRAGMELLLDYGEEWHASFLKKVRGWQRRKEREEKMDDADAKKRHLKGFVNGIDRKWDVMDIREKFNCPEELPTEKGKRDRIAVGMAVDSSDLKSGNKPYSEYRENTHHPYAEVDENPNEAETRPIPGPSSEEDITRSLPWLAQHGVCLSSGRLSLDESTVPYAGRGVFANTHIKKGEVVLTSPLLALRKDDVKIYKSDPDQQFVRNVLDKSTVIGYEMLINYAFGHEDSPLLLIPLAPLANFINHGGKMKSEKPKSKGANVRVQWPEDGGNAAKLFAWAYQHKLYEDDPFDDNEKNEYLSNPWLQDHPIDVMERSGKLALEYVAMRDIHNGEEILLDYGPLWEKAWMDLARILPYSRSGYFRHYIAVPEGFYPDNWLGVSDRYEIAEIDDLINYRLVGKAVPLTWAHNGKPVSSKYAYAVGLPKGFSDRFLEYTKQNGIIELYKNLLTEQEGYHLPSDGFAVYKPGTLVQSNSTASRTQGSAMEFFAHRYHSDQWNFNMHFVSAWEETARKSVLKALGDAGFDAAVKGIGERFGYDNMTCFHASYMGVTHCDKSKMHSDIYATEDKSWNIVFPLITVNGTSPELDIMAEDMNTVIGVHYLKDVAWAMGDFGYHQTRPIDYYNPDDGNVGDAWKKAGGIPIRVVFGAYCAQIDETNIAMLRHLYDGDDPAPFADQFVEIPMREIHWDKLTGQASLSKPLGKGY